MFINSFKTRVLKLLLTKQFIQFHIAYNEESTKFSEALSTVLKACRGQGDKAQQFRNLGVRSEW
jgi:hypothetical protein